MPHYRRLLLVAILAWSASAMAVQAQSEGTGEPCNALCRFWLGRDRPKEPPPPPVVAAEAPPPAETVQQQDVEPETLPIVRMKRKAALRTRRPASLPVALQPSDVPVEDGQGGARDVPVAPPAAAATVSQPMDLTPDEAAASAEPRLEVRPPPTPPRRPALRVRQARSRRPAPPSTDALTVSLSVAEPGSRQTAASAQASPGRDRPGRAAAPSHLGKPAIAPAAAVARPSAVAVRSPGPVPVPQLRPPQPPLVDMSDLRGVLPPPSAPSNGAPLGIVAPAGLWLSDTGTTSVGRTTSTTDPARLHDVAPGPRHSMTADTRSPVPAAAKGPDTANPDQALEDLKQTILRSAQEALEQSQGQGH